MAAAATLSLNCSDMPEVKFWACNAKMIGRSKGVGLPVLPESMNEGDEDFEMPPKEQERSWCCTTCTFRNHELVSHCEMCNTEKGAINMKVMVNASLTEQDHGDQWPALPDAWTKCDADACSVASSWLDVGEAQHADSDEEDFVVLKEGADAKQEAKSILWSAVVGRNALRAAPTAGNAAKASPVFRKLAVKTRKNKAEGSDEETDDVLEELESRRMLGSAKQRRCLTRSR